mmetsp:Transcript_39304/g.47598  ORF Transcript_39304/g.47598 Transcript_39304/m.47598 type:complete len:249 (-) Transcript_39304:461-1207(-)|eukprot:CAMPEP_0197856092 /NCGR_PEP_ID=MMETSP1438-20131217/27884_1 /TAXON_ID=1461541 /ORGANISM="Pterosperma sp., Strain CCMP1384" /LENGTH=248 /DNA_ID=CAMNT_0043471433 /DNA_START=426 /DNA_END=1172 /DNA_ORIENTATION=+
MVSFDEATVEEGFELQGDHKLEYISDLFDRIASSYDLVNLFISLGQTTIWRLLALSFLRKYLQPSARVLDVGCGTGWVSWYLSWRYKDLNLQVEGMDCSEGMLDEARLRHPKLEFAHGDVCKLAYQDNSFDMTTTVYTLRNFPELYTGLKEMVRVTQPGGTVVILDAFPVGGVMKWLLKIWLNCIMPYLAALFIARKPYQYLANSIQSTVPASEVAQMLVQLGCEDPVVLKKYSFGAAVCLIARKKTG